MLEVRDLSVSFGEVQALRDVDLEVDDGEVVALMGPSGSGKSTLLRVVAGLQPVDTGSLRWNGDDLGAIPPHRRGFGLMFQDYALFPHRTVAGNVAFGLEVTRLDAAEIRRRVHAALELVDLLPLANRRVHELSGGEQQRVALARALAPRPRLLMLDEPIGALDRTLRDRLIADFRHLFTELGLTILYVTHDQEEAFAVAPRTIVMRGGRIERDATPEEIWTDPGSRFIASFIGFDDVYDGTAEGGRVDVGWSVLPLDVPDGQVTIVLRPGAARIGEPGLVSGIVTDITYRGGSYETEVEVAPGTHVHAIADAPHRHGVTVPVQIDIGSVSVLDRERGL